MIRFLLLSIAAALGCESLAIAQEDCTVELRIRPIDDVFDATKGYIDGESLVVALHNTGLKTVTLVHPGDGSSSGHRTPTLTWFVDGELQEVTAGFCGNINPLKEGEILILGPGEVAQLSSWIPPIAFKKTGQHELQLHYVNNPGAEWVGGLLGKHDAQALEQLRNSTPCEVRSNKAKISIRSVRNRG